MRASERPSNTLAVAAGLSYATGAGFRPSDGAFLAPLFLYFVFLRLPRRQAVLCVATAIAAGLAWLIPNQIALSQHPVSTWNQLSSVAMGAILLGHFNIYTASSAVGIFLPLAIALGPLLPFVFFAKPPLRLPLWIAVLPSAGFYLLVFFSDAPYLDSMLGSLLLLGAVGISSRLSRPRAKLAICAAIVLNVATYAAFHPFTLPGKANLVARVVDKGVGMYTHYAIRHRLMIRLADDPHR